MIYDIWIMHYELSIMRYRYALCESFSILLRPVGTEQNARASRCYLQARALVIGCLELQQYHMVGLVLCMMDERMIGLMCYLLLWIDDTINPSVHPHNQCWLFPPDMCCWNP